FLEGKPLNVTDLEFGPDGALYFTTGGRATQSGLYRVRYIGAVDPSAGPLAAESEAEARGKDARALRRKLETFHGKTDVAAVPAAWP
ncbi:hypothetical protein, partial [Proteus terrae]|uniref:hypothetical protein n=1 Tax=Proteus terrae TaxID=1574161 RepID=UPI00301D43A7